MGEGGSDVYMEITKFQHLISSILLTHQGQLQFDPVFLYSAFENKFLILTYCYR